MKINLKYVLIFAGAFIVVVLWNNTSESNAPDVVWKKENFVVEKTEPIQTELEIVPSSIEETAESIPVLVEQEKIESFEGYAQMELSEVLFPNNVFHDPVFGVYAKYPDGWTVSKFRRWGAKNGENTVFLKPPEGSRAIPSMYYRKFTDTPPDRAYAEAVMRDQARLKEASRTERGMQNYKNDPESFVYREVDGNPSLSYFATYDKGDEVHAEYFMRILGDEGYVMFFVRGPVDDVSEVVTPVHEMGGTVTPP